ncbi:unnamed protein product [Mytilus coruscus]|uniref:Farnesoic acid O-methyl transferase domain-containing protein n=1 Tax=Mytilus coruscus TaxID=42192 RepID=A0A6J8F0X1_MYTCO|nr:unnamed protein product [Mytilus coruscus]
MKNATYVSNISSNVNSKTTSTEDTNSIEHAYHTSSTLKYLCSCKFSKEENQNSLKVPKDELKLRIKKRLDKLEHAIRINPKTTSKYRATRKSAANDRFSAKLIALPKEFVITDPEEQSLREEGIFHSDINYLQFSAKAIRDAHLSFDINRYIVIIGGWGNSKTTLHRNILDTPIDEYHGPVLERNTYNSFWISWNRSHMYVGKGNISGHNILLLGISECLPDAVDIRLHSAFGETVHWLINDADKDDWLLNTDLYCDNTLTSTSGPIENATDVPNISPSTQKISNIFAETDSTEQALYTSTKSSSTTLISACECPCSKLGKQNTTEFPIEEQNMHIRKRLEELENAIRINPKTTSKYRATRLSAADDLFSAKVIGYIGAFIICLLIGIVVLFDAIHFWQLRYSHT